MLSLVEDTITGQLFESARCDTDDPPFMRKDITPSNIVWNPETGQLKIIDFGISTELSRNACIRSGEDEIVGNNNLNTEE
jgi:serine/threonine protein kinase